MDSLFARASSLRQYASNVTWEPLVGFSRSTILSVLKQIRHGSLKIQDVDGSETTCGVASPDKQTLQTTLNVHKDTFWVRMLLFADMVGSMSPRAALEMVGVLTGAVGLCGELHARRVLLSRSDCVLRGMLKCS